MAWLIIAGVVAVAVFLVYEGSNLVTVDYDTSANYSPSIVSFAKSIAKAEGYGLPGAIPTLANNPGDLVIPHWQGTSLGSGISVFSNPFDGWNRLYHQLQVIVDGASEKYSLSDTIDSMAQKWTKTDPTNWALIVASDQGVSSNTPLNQILS